jgi:hypothetical protein
MPGVKVGIDMRQKPPGKKHEKNKDNFLFLFIKNQGKGL